MQYIKFLSLDILRMPSKNTILKAIHNRLKASQRITKLRMPSKNTILKAIHNTSCELALMQTTANAK